MEHEIGQGSMLAVHVNTWWLRLACGNVRGEWWMDSKHLAVEVPGDLPIDESENEGQRRKKNGC